MEEPDESMADALRKNLKKTQVNLQRLRENTKGLERTVCWVEENLARVKVSAKEKGGKGSKSR
jgi:hypothetical protein